MPNKHDFTLNDMENILIQFISPLVITGDFSSHNNSWGSKTTARRGKETYKAFD